MSVTSKFNTRAGDVTVTFTMPVFGGTDTFQIYDIGTFDYDFDVTAFGSVVNNLGAMYGRSKITVDRYTDSGRDFFTVLYNELYVSNFISGKIPVEFVVSSYTGQTYRFAYEIRGNGLEYQENTNKITLELDPILPTTTVSGVFSAVTPKLDVNTAATSVGNGIAVGNFIQYVVSGLNSSLSTIYEPAQTTTGFASLTYPTAPTLPQDSVVACIRNVTSVSGLAINDVATYAVLGGDIYGTGFDNNFYVNRARTDRSVSIPYDDIESLKYQITPSPYRAIILTLDGTSGFIVDTSITGLANPRADKAISGLYSLPTYVVKGKMGNPFITPQVADIDYTGYLTRDLEPVIVGSGIAAHEKALNARSTPLVRVEMTVQGFDKIKPYQSITFGDGVPDQYRYASGTTVRYYRPTYLSYDLKEDKVKVKMYGIT